MRGRTQAQFQVSALGNETFKLLSILALLHRFDGIGEVLDLGVLLLEILRQRADRNLAGQREWPALGDEVDLIVEGEKASKDRYGRRAHGNHGPKPENGIGQLLHIAIPSALRTAPPNTDPAVTPSTPRPMA